MAMIAGLLAATGLAATANAAPVPVSVVNWDLIMNSQGFPQKLAGDCLDPSRAGYGWQDFSTRSPFRYTRVFEGVGIAAAGSFDPVTRSGSLAGKDPALRVDNYNAHSRAIRVGALGFKTSGAGAVVTGRIERTRTIFSRFGPPKPLLRIKRFTFSTGPFQRKGKDVADTFIMALYGRATVMPALARELTRIRCHGPHIVTSHPIRAGSSFGAVRLQMRPDAATGVGGTFDISKIRVDADSESGQPATITPSTLHVDLPADLRTPLRCESAYNCAPAAGAQFALGGGFTVSLGDRSVTVTDLTVAYEAGSTGAYPAVSGMVDGTPLLLFRGSEPTQEFEDLLTTSLGVYQVRLFPDAVAAHFLKTAPPG